MNTRATESKFAAGARPAPTFGPQSEIDEAAQRILKEELAGQWTVRDRPPDVHIDYEIEHKSGGEPTALTVYVQLKGQRKLEVVNGCAVVRIKTKHLRYWETARRPVMLVRTDTTQRKSYFLFVQQWLRETTTPEALARKSSRRLRIPLANDLGTPDLFLTAARQADRYLRDLHSTSPEQAIASVEQELAALDRRFRISLTATKNQRHYTIHPAGSEPVELKLTMPALTPDQRRRTDDAFGWGKPSRIAAHNVRIEGSPLFEHLTEKPNRFELKLAGTTRPAELRLTAGLGEPRTLRIPGMLSAGPAGLAFTPQAGLAIGAELALPLQARVDGVGKITFTTNADAWCGQRLLSIQSLEEIAGFAQAATTTKDLATELRIGPVGMLRSRKAFRSAGLFETVAWWSGLLLDAAGAALCFGLDPVVPDLTSVSDETIAATQETIQLARRGSKFLPYFDIELNADGLAPFADGQPEVAGSIQVETPLVVNLLGIKKSAGILRLEPAAARLLKQSPVDPGAAPIVRVFPTEATEFRFQYFATNGSQINPERLASPA